MNCPICSTSCHPMPSHPDAVLYRCPGCTHAFTDPDSIRAPEQYGASYYEEDHKRWFEHPNIKLFQEILTVIPKGASVLDVGCGRGDFLKFARAQRPDLALTGIDLSENASEAGIEFLRGDILMEDLGTTFDVIVSLAVIEHVAGVVAFTKRMQELAKPSGVVIVMTLNDGSLLYASARLGRSLGIPLAFNRLYSVHHLHHFTRGSLAKLLTNGGCVIQRHLDHNAPVHAMDLPVKSQLLDSVLRLGLRGLWVAGKATRRSYLQTVVCARQ